MHSKKIPWYKTKWGLVFAVIFSPFWYIWKSSRKNRYARTFLGLGIAIVLFIVIVSAISSLLNGSSVNTGSQTQSETQSQGSNSSNVVLTGYGATQTEWDSTHTEDSNFAADTTYDPNNNLGNGYGDTYVAVLWTNGRALGYQMGFPSNTSLDNAKAIVMKEFPTDADILWQQQNNSDSVNICYQMEVHSNTLGQVLGTDGDVFVEFQTITGSDTSTSVGYYSNNVNNALLRNTDYKEASDVGGC